MEYSPPPLFNQGASARVKVVVFALIAISLLVIDARMQALDARMRPLVLARQAVGTVLYPLQMAALVPRDVANRLDDFFSSQLALEKENRELKTRQIVNAQALQQAQQLLVENAQLRKLLNTGELLPVKSVMTEILYDTRDAFTRKIVLDRGAQHGVTPGQPVIDDAGVVGQITRVFPFTAEATLLTDKDQAIPVQVVRSGLRSVAYGRGQSGVLDLRFMATNADIQKDDILVTSGIDGVYPSGLSVAKVARVESKSSDAFARIVCQPTAGIDRNRQLLILLTEAKPGPRPAPENLQEKKPKKHASKDAAQTASKKGEPQNPPQKKGAP